MSMKYEIVTLHIFPAIDLSRVWQIYEAVTIKIDPLGLNWETSHPISFEN